ncbi:hypothetical protein ACQKWADRAFT_129645 [Trichoderma austrokoningii]
MKAATIFAVTFAALAQAQTRADIPSCALPCLDDAVKANTKCSTTDYACICKDFSTVQTAATSCVISKCGADVAINKVLPATQALCANPGSGSSAAGSSSAAASSSAAGTTSAVAQTTAAQTSSAASSAPVSSAPVSSAPASSAPASSAAAGTGASTVVTSVTPVGTGSSPSGNRTTTGPTGAPTNAGSALLPGLAMLALGALAL